MVADGVFRVKFRILGKKRNACVFICYHISRVRRDKANDAAEKCALAAAVFTDESRFFAFVETKGNIIEKRFFPPDFGEFAYRQKIHKNSIAGYPNRKKRRKPGCAAFIVFFRQEGYSVLMVLLDEAHIELLFERLSSANPLPVTELLSRNTYTLLVAVVLSAQMTDKGVNKISGALFDAADTPEKMLALGEEGLREYIKSINLFPTKAKRIIALSRILVDEFGGEVPSSRESLERLPGVGRKTANVMLNVAFGESTLAVDTHILRIAPRTGLSASTKPLQVELDLLKIIPGKFRRDAHHWLLLHGRYVCVARKPHCTSCCLEDFCPKNGLEKDA